MKFLCNKKIPNHIAIIMDGNGRWANLRNKPRFYGHKKGVKNITKIINFSINYNINILTLYAFSTENWNRPYNEVYNLMKLFSLVLKKYSFFLNKKKVCVNIIGDRNRLPNFLYNDILNIELITKNNLGLKLNIAINYGGRWDIVNFIRNIFYKIKNNLINLNELNEKFITNNLCLGKLSPVDLVIRTGGEKRISNFLLWQIAYSELFFFDKLWPDFSICDFLFVLDNFSKRKRKFGKL